MILISVTFFLHGFPNKWKKAPEFPETWNVLRWNANYCKLSIGEFSALEESLAPGGRPTICLPRTGMTRITASPLAI